MQTRVAFRSVALFGSADKQHHAVVAERHGASLVVRIADDGRAARSP